MRVTLFGASGLLGQELVQALSGEQLTALSVEDADLRDHARVRDVIRDSRPDWILLSGLTSSAFSVPWSRCSRITSG